MTKSIFILGAGILMLGLASCTKKFAGVGPSVTKTYTVSNFTGVNLAMDAEVTYVLDSVCHVEITAQENIHDLMKVNTQSNTLNIGFKTFVNLLKHDPIKIRVHAPALEMVEVSGSGSVHAIGQFASNNFEANVSGSGKVEVDYIQAFNLDVNISGSGSVWLNGGVSESTSTHISGSGKVEMTLHKSSQVITHTSGSGNTKVWAEKTLNATISGSGDVYYKGNPAIETHISGSGKIIKL